MIRTFSMILVCAVLATVLVSAVPAQDSDAGAKAQIRRDIETYMRSVDLADPNLAATVWLTTPDVSFISPVGHDRGWEQIADDIYVKLMGQTFSKRHLTAKAEPVIHVYNGDAAVAEFDWDFVATLRSNGSPGPHHRPRKPGLHPLPRQRLAPRPRPLLRPRRSAALQRPILSPKRGR